MLRTIRIKDLSLVRGERRLFSGLDLEISAGQAVALTGRNGAGKTSLLRAVAGLLRPAHGDIGFEGEAGPLEAEVARSDALHLVGHHDGLKSTRSAWEELRFQSLWTGGSEASARVAATWLDLDRLLDLEIRRLVGRPASPRGSGPAAGQPPVAVAAGRADGPAGRRPSRGLRRPDGRTPGRRWHGAGRRARPLPVPYRVVEIGG